MARSGTSLTHIQPATEPGRGYVRFALLALAAAAAFLGAAVVGVASAPGQKLEVFLSLPWLNGR